MVGRLQGFCSGFIEWGSVRGTEVVEVGWRV